MAKDLNYTLSLKDLFSKRMQSAVNETGKLDSKMSRTASIADNLGTKIAGAFAVGGVISFGKAVFASLDNFQKFHSSVRAMLQGNEFAAKGLESQLISLARTSPFSLKDVQKGTKQLMAYGFKAGEITSTLKMLGDVTAGTGSELDFIIRAFGQIKSKGHLAGQELNQLTEQGFNPLKIISEKTGKSYDFLLKEMEAGKITFKDVEQSFKDVTKSGGLFFGMMDEQSKTAGGRWSAISDTWEQIRVNIGKSQEGIIASTLAFIDRMSTKLNDKLASANFVEEAMKRSGVEKFSAMESFYGNIGGLRNVKALAGNYAETQDLAMYVQNLVENTKDMASAAKNLQLLSAGIGAARREKKEGKIDDIQLRNITAIRQEGINLIQGQMQNMMSKPATAQEKKDTLESLAKSSSTAMGTGVSITAQRPQSLTINITKLVEHLNLTSQDLKDGTAKIREEVSKIFLEMVNDANLVLTK